MLLRVADYICEATRSNYRLRSHISVTFLLFIFHRDVLLVKYKKAVPGRVAQYARLMTALCYRYVKLPVERH